MFAYPKGFLIGINQKNRATLAMFRLSATAGVRSDQKSNFPNFVSDKCSEFRRDDHPPALNP